jgi:hypothetical protein
MFCSNDCFSAENADFYFEGVVCSGEFRIHNPKVGGSIPPPATNILNLFNELQEIEKSNSGRVVISCCTFSQKLYLLLPDIQKCWEFLTVTAHLLRYLGAPTPRSLLKYYTTLIYPFNVNGETVVRKRVH